MRPRDLIRATVSAAGGRVTIVLADLSTRRTFSRNFHPSQIDASSAEWIVEAPSECTNSGECFTLPLADFARASAFAARATTSTGRSGTITSRWWVSTVITLVPHGSRFFADIADQAGEAVPSALTAGGSAFTVTYRASSQPSGSSGSPGPVSASDAARIAAGRLIQPVR